MGTSDQVSATSSRRDKRLEDHLIVILTAHLPASPVLLG